MKSLIGTDMEDYFFALSVRTKSVCILLTTCILWYIFLLKVVIGLMFCFYSLFSQHS